MKIIYSNIQTEYFARISEISEKKGPRRGNN